jgi:hypothetical protein
MRTLQLWYKFIYKGRHRCPRQKIPSDFRTSYNQYYKAPTPITLTPKPSYNYQPRHYNPESLQTHYKQTYQPYKIESQERPSSRLASLGVKIR